VSTTIGRVDWIAGIDGTLVPAEARRLGDRIGQALGQAASRRAGRAFSSGLGSDWDVESSGARLGQRLAAALGASFQGRFQAAIGDAGASIRKAIDPAPLRQFNETAERGVYVMYEQKRAADEVTVSHNRFAEALGRVNARMRTFVPDLVRSREGSWGLGNAMRFIRDRATSAFSSASDGGRRFGEVISGLNDNWRGMSHGLRQGIFYVALFATLATQIAVLGSAAGAGLTILAGAAVAAGVGLGVAIAAFQGLTGELSELPAAVQPAADAFQALGDVFGALQEAIQIAALDSLAPSFEALGGLVTQLTPAFVLVADAVGRVIEQLVTMLTSANGVSVLTTLIAGAAPIFELLASAAFNLGGALGNIFVAAQPFIMTFVTWLNDLFTRFNEWTQSIAGQNALQEWFSNAQTVFAALEPLLGQIGTFMSNLVTPATIASLVTFMEIIGQALGPLSAFLVALDSFGIFNIIAQLLQTVFAALAPLMPLFTIIGNAIQTLLIGALQALTPILTMVAQAFTALAMPLLAALLPAIMAILPVFQQLILALTPVFALVGQLAAQLGAVLAPIITVLAQLFITLLAAIMPIVTAVLPPLIAIISAVIDAIMPLISAILPPLVDLFTAVMGAIMPIIPVVTELIGEILSLIEPLLELIGPILGPLTDLLRHLVTAGVEFLKIAISFLTPIILGLANGIRDTVIPIINILKSVIQGLGDFLSNVFAGNWSAAWESIWGTVLSVGEGIAAAVKGIINGLISVINGMIGGVNNVTGALGIPAIPKIPRLAKGGIVWQSTIANIGEAGPEMVVPLRRPLGMIDPAVRDVAAYAQGKHQGGGGGNTFNEGAIVVVDRSGDPRRTANEVFQRVVEGVAS
jgi:phage-related protein